MGDESLTLALLAPAELSHILTIPPLLLPIHHSQSVWYGVYYYTTLVEVWNAQTLKPDMLVGDVKAADFDAIIFECGQPLDENDPEALRVAREAVEQGKVLAANCMMPVILANTGVLEGKRATCNSNYASFLENKGTISTGSIVERDGNVITAIFDGHEQVGWIIAEALAG